MSDLGQFMVFVWFGCLLAVLTGASMVAWWCVRQLRAAFGEQIRLALRDLPALAQARPQPADAPGRNVDVAQAVRQAIQIELEFQERQQAERDQARAEELRRWQADQERRAQEFRALLHVMSAQSAKGPLPSASAVAPAPSPEPSRGDAWRAVPRSPEASTSATSARPPELMHTPLPRPQPEFEPEAAAVELSDAEIDALPAEVPMAVRPRKRILPAPAKPVLRDL